MAALSDFLSTGFSSTPLAWQLMSMTPGDTRTKANLTEDATIGSTRALQDYQQRTIPDIKNNAAAMGNFGSSGFQDRMSRASTDYGRNQNDISRMLNRNLAAIAKNKLMATMGGMFA